MKIIKMYLDNNQYFHEYVNKVAIYLHHTGGGSAPSAIEWWNETKARVGTSDVVERNGDLYEAFDPSDYAFHLGVSNDDNFMEKASINIEIVSYGPLVKVGDEFYAKPLGFNHPYQKLITRDEVITFKSEWRGFLHYQKYTDYQIKTVVERIKQHIKKFGIVIQKDLTNFYEYNPSVLEKHTPGLYSHSTVRKDKNDIIPQPELLSALNTMVKELYPEPPKPSVAQKERKEK